MNEKQIMPGLFGQTVAADTRRGEFDWKNEQILSSGLRPDIVFIGDSITQLWELSCYFPAALRIVKRGISGDQIRYIARRFEADVVQLHPRWCVLLAGINDSWGLEYDPAAFMGGEDPQQLLHRVKGYFDAVMQQAWDAGIQLAVCSLLPVDMPYRQCDVQRNEYILQLNIYLRERCAQQGMLYVDYHAGMTDGTGQRMRSGLTHEGLHPNAAGYEIMGQVLRRALLEQNDFLQKDRALN